MLVRDQIANSLTEVPQELVTGFSTFDHLPGENRHPRQRIIAAPLLELGDHVVGPVLRTRLPAIGNHVPDAALAHVIRADRVFVTIKVAVHVLLDVAVIQFVDLKASSFCCRRMVGDSQE